MPTPAPLWALLVQGQRMLLPPGSAPSGEPLHLFCQAASGKHSDPKEHLFSPEFPADCTGTKQHRGLCAVMTCLQCLSTLVISVSLPDTNLLPVCCQGKQMLDFIDLIFVADSY